MLAGAQQESGKPLSPTRQAVFHSTFLVPLENSRLSEASLARRDSW